jgi:pimeloyl-ACP methyl ester carboxylesterase
LDECWTNINGVKIRYLESGRGKNQHLLFIHGLGSAADRWMKIPDLLSSDFHCVAIDLPGFGESDKPSNFDYTIPQFREIINAFQKEISLNDGQTSLIGHSLGGYIATDVVINKKNQIKKLVLIDSSGFLIQPTPILEEYLNAAMRPTRYNVRKVFEKMVTDSSRVPDQLVDGFIKRITMPNAKLAFESTLAHSAKTQISLDRLLQNNSTPTLILWGEKDMVIPLNHSKIFHNSIKNSQLEVIEDAGHAPFAEKPDKVCKILRNFLL